MRSSRVGPHIGYVDSLVELVLPRVCLGCGAAGINWCRPCLAGELAPVLHRPDPCPSALPEVAAAAAYSGSVRQAILAAKERDRRELDRPLGLLLAAATALLLSSTGSSSGSLWLVPVPAGRAALRSRGRDHLADWAEWAVRALRAENVRARRVSALLRRAGGMDSVGLDASQRAANLAGAFVLGPVGRPGPQVRVVILDDIVTTGATLAAASTCLRSAFCLSEDRIGAAVVAATERTG